jgi:hypothetical protein
VWRSREAFGLEDEWTVYMCAQSLFKLHPSFDFVLRDVLVNDPNAHVVLTADRRPLWTKRFKQRLKRALRTADVIVEVKEVEGGGSVNGRGGVSGAGDDGGDGGGGGRFVLPWREAEVLADSWAKVDEDGVDLDDLDDDDEDGEDGEDGNIDIDDGVYGNTSIAGERGERGGRRGGKGSLVFEELWRRVHVVDRQPPGDGFLQLLHTADVVLHPFPFDGSRTSSEALALGLPTLTLPSDQVKSYGVELG